MLAIKTYLFSVNGFSTIIFDEIDAGVSGDIGRKMGRILKKLRFGCLTGLIGLVAQKTERISCTKVKQTP